MIKKLKIKLKTGDPVIVNTGQNKGKIDYIFKIDRNKGLVYLKNVSRKKFDLSTFESKKESKIKEIMIPIHISNISY
jgi:ribosomal protein L24